MSMGRLLSDSRELESTRCDVVEDVLDRCAPPRLKSYPSWRIIHASRASVDAFISGLRYEVHPSMLDLLEATERWRETDDFEAMRDNLRTLVSETADAISREFVKAIGGTPTYKELSREASQMSITSVQSYVHLHILSFVTSAMPR